MGPADREVDLSDLPGQVARVAIGVREVCGSLTRTPSPAIEHTNELGLLAAVILGGILSHCERFRLELDLVEHLNGAAAFEEHRLVHTVAEVLPEVTIVVVPGALDAGFVGDLGVNGLPFFRPVEDIGADLLGGTTAVAVGVDGGEADLWMFRWARRAIRG